MSKCKAIGGFQGWSVVIAAGLIILGLTACRTEDIRTQAIEIPEAKTDGARLIVSNALAQLEGVVASSIHFDEKTVVVTYDSMKLALKNMEFAIADSGFSANDTPANATQRAALPASLRE